MTAKTNTKHSAGQGKRTLPKKPGRTEVLTVRLTAPQYDTVAAAYAVSDAGSMSDFLRDAALDKARRQGKQV
jgi:uncharacterized protein (DUF1778 family)